MARSNMSGAPKPKPKQSSKTVARRKAATNKMASEGPKKSVASKNSILANKMKKPTTVTESGVGNIPATVVRLGLAVAKQVSRNGAKPKPLSEKTIREATEFEKLMTQQSAKTASAKSRQATSRTKQLARDSSEVSRSKSANAFTKREIAESNKAINRQRAINRANAVNKATKNK